MLSSVNNAEHAPFWEISPEKDILPEEIQTIWNIIRGKEKCVRNGRSTHLAVNVNDVEQANCSHVEKIRRRRTRVSPIQ